MTKIYADKPQDKSSWKRMLKTSNLIWEGLDKPDGKLIPGKGWNYEIPLDTVIRFLVEQQIPFGLHRDKQKIIIL